MSSENLINFTNKAIRKKSERKQLQAYDCEDCYNYYKSLNLNDDEIKKRIQNCSRHRSNIESIKEPDHYWDLDFPSEEEVERRRLEAKKKNKF